MLFKFWIQVNLEVPKRDEWLCNKLFNLFEGNIPIYFSAFWKLLQNARAEASL